MISNSNRAGNTYYRSMAILMIIIAIGGFSLNGIINHNKMPSPYPLLILHVSVMVSWYILFVIQTQLIGRRNRSLHKQLGRWSVLLAIAILVFGISINYTSYKRDPDPLIVGINFGALLNFALAYLAGYFWRKWPGWHKRVMLLAGISILAPALARIVVAFSLPVLFVFISYFLMILSLIGYDLLQQKKPHRVSLIGGLGILLGLLGSGAIGSTKVWAEFLTKIWG